MKPRLCERRKRPNIRRAWDVNLRLLLLHGYKILLMSVYVAEVPGHWLVQSCRLLSPIRTRLCIEYHNSWALRTPTHYATDSEQPQNYSIFLLLWNKSSSMVTLSSNIYSAPIAHRITKAIEDCTTQCSVLDSTYGACIPPEDLSGHAHKATHEIITTLLRGAIQASNLVAMARGQFLYHLVTPTIYLDL